MIVQLVGFVALGFLGMRQVFDREACIAATEPRPLPKLIGNKSRDRTGGDHSSIPTPKANAGRSGGVPWPKAVNAATYSKY